MTSGLVRKRRQKPQKVVVLQGKIRPRAAHNPEVVGSSPASATIKSTGFRMKSGVFLTFWGKMENPKIPMGLAVGLVLDLLKVHKGENPTFLGKLDFLYFRSFLNKSEIFQSNMM